MGSPLPTPTNSYDLDLPDIYRKTCSGHLLPELPRILIFATAQNLRLMAESSHWYADGTFKTTPLIFYQLWTLHVLYNKTVIPTIFALLPNKTKITYIRVLDEIKRLQNNVNPISVMIDFEQDEINAFTHSFPSITVRGCFFHMTQSIWRHIQSDSELLSHYLDRDAGSDWSIKIRQMVSLAFVPVEDVFDAFYGLLHTQFYQDNESVLDKLITYYEATWIGKILRNGVIMW
ncbi:uncharacterized protein LOC135924440 [Gordionus sp. m RMFG-2023]|uniref:uncharacterized protein LOC135924440 n=1 Tax=Gordionus sp. m RMFG-2023 TaxID=3053472 RepID=UPI0031FD81BC